MATDKISEDRLARLHPRVRDIALVAYREAVRNTPVGVHPFITEGMRSFERSDALYAQGRTAPGPKVTNAPGGASMHNYGLAIDFVNMVNNKMAWNVDKNWMIVVAAFKKHGFTWGGDFKSIKDAPHFEMTFGYTWRQLLDKHNKKQVDCNGYVII